MNLSEPKNLRRSKASFRRSKSNYSGFSDDDTNIFTSKKMRSTICVPIDEGIDLFTDRFSQDDASFKEEKAVQSPKELTQDLLKGSFLSKNKWKFSY